MNQIQFCDLHCDTAMELIAGNKLDDTRTQVNLPAMTIGNVAIQLFACYVPPSIPDGERAPLVSNMLDHMKKEIDVNSEHIALCTEYDDIVSRMQEGVKCAVMTIENGMALENDLRNLQKFYDDGIRCITIVHAVSHDWALSSNDKSPAFDGLTPFGEKVIAAMNEMGMIIDLSHAHDTTVEKVMKISKLPVIATHSCVRKLCDSPRNLSDDLIRKFADSGGMIGINFYPGFLDDRYAKLVGERAGSLFSELSRMEKKAGNDIEEISRMFQQFRVTLKDKMSDARVSMERIFQHVQYIIDLAGDDCVGFGSDFDGIPDTPENFDDCGSFRYIADWFHDAGFSAERMNKISHQNFLRIFKLHNNC